MITTRLHGTIDYATAGLIAAVAVLPATPRPVRRVLAAAAAYHTSYSVLTDYEAGVTPLISWRTHRALDMAGAATLLAASLLMRRQPQAIRALLAGLGLAEAAVIALSRATPTAGPVAKPSRATYPPLDTPKRVADDIWIVDSTLPGATGAVLATRMMVIRLPDGSLLLHSPTRLTLPLKHALERIGPIRHLLAPNFAHWIFLLDWQRACPDAVLWAAHGLSGRRQVRQSGLRIDHELDAVPPESWGEAIELIPVPGTLGFEELALHHRPTRTLILTDLVLNLERDHLPPAYRPVARLLGMTEPDGTPPPYLRAIIRRRRPASSRAAARLVALAPERVLFAHGRPFEGNATASLRQSLSWLLD